MSDAELMREVSRLRIRNAELERMLAVLEAAQRAKAARATLKRRSDVTKTDAQREGARVIAKTRASIEAACRRGLVSNLGMFDHKTNISMYAEALGISWESAKLRVEGQYAVLKAAGQPFNARAKQSKAKGKN